MTTASDDLDQWSRGLNAAMKSLFSRPPLAISAATYELLALDLRDAADLAEHIAARLRKMK